MCRLGWWSDSEQHVSCVGPQPPAGRCGLRPSLHAGRRPTEWTSWTPLTARQRCSPAHRRSTAMWVRGYSILFRYNTPEHQRRELTVVWFNSTSLVSCSSLLARHQSPLHLLLLFSSHIVSKFVPLAWIIVDHRHYHGTWDKTLPMCVITLAKQHHHSFILLNLCVCVCNQVCVS